LSEQPYYENLPEMLRETEENDEEEDEEEDLIVL
jgi:hypothetical protein